MKNKAIIIDISALDACPSQVSGVPRVVVEYTKRLIKTFSNIVLVAYNYNDEEYHIVDISMFLSYTQNFQKKYKKFVTSKKILVKDFPENAIFFDPGPMEINYKRSTLYAQLKQKSISIISIVHDVIPLTYTISEQQERSVFYFINMFSAIFKYSDYIIAVSESELKKINIFRKKINSKQKTIVIPNGLNPKKDVNRFNINKKIINLCKKRYFLMVGTIAPRKNHLLVLKTFNKYLDKFSVNLIIAGHKGWKTEYTINYMKQSPNFNRKIFFLDSPNDDEIAYLYKNAYGSIMSSSCEGFGIPVIESLYYGCPVFCSNIPIFHEVSKEMGVFFDPKSAEKLATKLKFYLNDNSKYKNLKRKCSRFTFNSWDDSFKLLLNIFTEIIKKGE